MEVELKDGYMIIKTRYTTSPSPSKKGKTLLVASENDRPVGLAINGSQVRVQVNAMISNPDYIDVPGSARS